MNSSAEMATFDLYGICRCCHTRLNALCRRLDQAYVYGGMVEDYTAMLQEALYKHIRIKPFGGNTFICEPCVQLLKNSWWFMQQVLRCENRLEMHWRREIEVMNREHHNRSNHNRSTSDSSESESEANVKQEDNSGNDNKLENDNNLAYRYNSGYDSNPANGNNCVNHSSHHDNNREHENNPEYVNNLELVFHPVCENNLGNEDVIDILSDDENQVENGGLIRLVSGEILNRAKLTHHNDEIMVITDDEREVGIEEIRVESEVNMFDNEVLIPESEVVSDLGPEDSTVGIGGVIIVDPEDPENDVIRTESDHVSGLEPEGKIKVEIQGVVSRDTSDVSNLGSFDEAIGEGEEATGEELDSDEANPKKVVDKYWAIFNPEFEYLQENPDRYFHICKMCGTKANTRIDLFKHFVHTHPEMFRCSYCSRMCSHSEYLPHVQIHLTHECEYCRKSFSRQALQNHVLVCPNKIYVCNTCNASFESKMKITHHIQTVHTTVPFYKCSVCSERFVSKKIRKAHLLTHKRQFKCEVCLKSYKLAGSLRRHMKKPHQPIKTRYYCELCQKKFPKNMYRSHVNNCGKPVNLDHKCCICDETFSSKYKLKSHLKSHT